MKKYLLVSVFLSIMILFAGCPHQTEKPKVEEKTTKLTINNQSSAELGYVPSGYSGYISIYPSMSFTDEMNKGLNGYITLIIMWSDHRNKHITRTVAKTQDFIVLEAGEHKTITITNNTLVIPENKQTAVTIKDLKPSVLYIDFEDIRFDKKNMVSYNGVVAKEGDYNGGYSEYTVVCSGSVESFIQFNWDGLPVQTTEKVHLEKGETKTISITDETEITVYGKKHTISKLVTSLRILTVTNNSSAVIKNLYCFDGFNVEDFYKNSLSKGESCHLSTHYYNDDSYLEFILITKTGKEIKLKAKKLPHASGRHKEFSLYDHTEVSYESSTKYLIDFFNENY